MRKIPKIILMIESSREFGRGLLSGIANYSSLHGPWTFYRMPAFYLQTTKIKTELEHMKHWGADGIIMREIKDMEMIYDMKLPTIVSTYSREFYDGLANISVENYKMGTLAAEHLINRGFKNFGYCGFDDMFWSLDRAKGFADRLSQDGHEVHFYQQPRTKTKRLWDNEQHIVSEWLNSLPKPVGLMACIDERSQHIIEACKISGLHVPEDVAVVGGDNDELICGLSNPPLSSVAVNAVRGGYESAELMDKLIKGEKMDGKIVKIRALKVTTRQSTDILAINDRTIAEAVRFIRENARVVIQVSDVVNVVKLSRRALEKRFQNTIGHSINKEITRSRVEHIARLLLETNMSILQIAVTMGYHSDKNMARIFRQQMGITLREYRKKYGTKK